MALTRANVESDLVSRQKSRMEAVSMAVTYAGSNADLNNPIGFAIRQMGGTVASFASVADSDLAFLDEEDYDQLIDIAEYRLLLNIKGRWGKVDIRAGQLTENLSQFTKDLDMDVEAKLEILKAMYGFGAPVLGVGVIDLDFAQTDEDDDE